MSEVLDFFSKLFDTADWPPRWHCGKWTQFHGWLYIISDLLIWSAYFAIPLIILKFISRKSKARFVRAYFLFAAFILACGSTHLLDAITFWFPAYRLNALVRFITGVVSWATVFYMIRIMPEAMTLKTNEELEKEVAERKKAEQELRITNQQFSVAQDIANLGHWQWDFSTNRIQWSDKLHAIYGVPPRTEINFERYLQQIHRDDRDRVKELMQKAREENHIPAFYHRVVWADGTERMLLGKGEVLTNSSGEMIGMIGTAQDVTEQERAKQALVEKTYALENINQELQRFAYVASHDLQEPLRKILTFASLLQEEASANFSTKGRLYVEKIGQSAARMQHLVEDILQFSRLRGKDKRFEKVSLQFELEQVLSDMEVVIAQTGADISCDPLPEIEAFPTQMRQLFQNLIGNAIKFTRPGENPRIHIGVQSLSGRALSQEPLFQTYSLMMPAEQKNLQQARFYLITVADQGIGFDPVYSEKIFEIFQRLHSGSAYSGTGIGLAICKRIAENHHGAISVRSEPSKGTTFYIVLPAMQEYFSL